MGFKKLTNKQWSKIKPYLSKRASVERARADDKQSLMDTSKGLPMFIVFGPTNNQDYKICWYNGTYFEFHY